MQDNHEKEDDVVFRDVNTYDDDAFDNIDDVFLSGVLNTDYETVISNLKLNSNCINDSTLSNLLEDSKLYLLLSEGFGEKNLQHVRFSRTPISLPVARLITFQSEIELDDSLLFQLENDCSYLFEDNPINVIAPIFSYRKMFILDGKKRWSQVYMINPRAHISTINFNTIEDSPFRPYAAYRKAVAKNANNDIPVTSVYNMSKQDIRSYVSSRIQKVCWKSLVDVGVCRDKESAVDYICKNIHELKIYNPPSFQ